MISSDANPSRAILEHDQQRRWQPHPQAVQHAQVLLAAEPHADVALVPMYMPGKTKGHWAAGQPVRSVAGIVLLSQNIADTNGFVADHSWARGMAARIAALELQAWAVTHPDIHNRAGEAGTVGWATVHRDGFVAVTEDALAPTELLRPPGRDHRR